jgi:hypothetical protein
MNNPVNFETAKLLKEKGFDVPASDCYNLNGLLFSNGWCEYIADDHEFDGLIYPNKLKEKDVLAPTIAEVVMWLYDKHGIWIIADPCVNFECWTPGVFTKSDTNLGKYKGLLELNTPTEAYEAAIIYTLKNLI